ncbi:hypothetical protein FRB96_008377 [Tulasnella sp. 330]|nr:hypothetical protein FRB96_008377 [Tulasnella sp. 330]
MVSSTRNHDTKENPDATKSPARKKPRLSAEKERDGRPRQPRSSNTGQSSPGAKARRKKAIEMALGGSGRAKIQEDSYGVASSSKGGCATLVLEATIQPYSAIESTEEVIPSSQEEPEKLSNTDCGPEGTAPTITPILDISMVEVDAEPANSVEPDMAEWFRPAASQASFVPAFKIYSGATSRVGNEWTVPSQQALEIASQRLAEWQREDSVEASPSVGRKVLGSVENVPSIARPPIPAAKFQSPVHRIQPPPSGRQNAPAFVPPAIRSRINSVGPAAYQGSPLNPCHSSASQFTSSSQTRPAPALGFATPVKLTPTSLPLTPRSSRPARAVFATPFKSGVKPGVAGRTPADIMQQKQKEQAALAAEKERMAEEKRRKDRERAVFDLTPPPERNSMYWHGIVPKSYTAEELYRRGVPNEIPSINLRNAQYYRFNAPTFSQVTSGSAELHPLGTNDALASLREKGCSLATPAWVDNHWAMILWKLASLICASPDRLKDKWTFQEVLNQLLYRYERELNRVQRPAFRLITEGDASSTRPMTVCVSAITPGETGITEEGEPVVGIPVLDVTDGWYRLRATIDEPIARAIKRGILKVGTKISVSGARLLGTKDGIDPLEAYNKGVHLQLHGNSTTLARWDTKLGFQNSTLPFIATLRSLTPDGGPVMLMDIVVTKSFPVAYIEALKDQGGDIRPKPRCELEERQEENAWQNRRSNEEVKLRDAFEKRMGKWEGIAERLDGIARGFRPPADDYPSSHIEDVYDELEESQDIHSLIKDLSPQESGWLASVIRSKSNLARERVGEVISKELDDVCPPRDVRNFCVIRFRDTRVVKHDPMREGQLTVWDVVSLGKDALAEGKRFLVTNIAPSSLTAWSHHNTDGMSPSSPLSVGGVAVPGYPPIKHFQHAPVNPQTTSTALPPSHTPRPLISTDPNGEVLRVGEEDVKSYASEVVPVPSSKALGKRRAQIAPVAEDMFTTNSPPPRPAKKARAADRHQDGKKDQKPAAAPKSKGEITKPTVATAATRRVQPPRSRRGGPGIGSSAVDVMILESHQRAVQNKYTVEPDAVFLITTDSAQAPSASQWEDEEPHQSYFDRPEVQQQSRREEMIQTPEFSLLEEQSAVGSRLRARAVLEEVVDTSDAVYERRHRKYETFEKRQRFREKEKLQYEHFKLRERMDELRVMDVHSFDRVQGMDDIPPEERKRTMLKEGEELDQRYSTLLNEKKGASVGAAGHGKRKGLGDERAESEMGSSDVGSRIRLRLKRGKAPIEQEPELELEGDLEGEKSLQQREVGSDEEREAGEVEMTIGLGLEDFEGIMDDQDDEAGDEEEHEAEADEDVFPSPRRRAPTKKRQHKPAKAPSRKKKRQLSSSSLPPEHDLEHEKSLVDLDSHSHLILSPRPHYHNPTTSTHTNAIPTVLQAALKSKEVAQPNAKRRLAPRGGIAFGVNLSKSIDTSTEFELPRYIVRDVELLRGDGDEQQEELEAQEGPDESAAE